MDRLPWDTDTILVTKLMFNKHLLNWLQAKGTGRTDSKTSQGVEKDKLHTLNPPDLRANT